MEALPLNEAGISEASLPPQDQGDARPHIRVRAWGVRGSIPTPSPGVLRFGGNTPCVEVVFVGDDGHENRMVLDAGTGIRNLGMELLKTGSPDKHFHIFLTHFHWDHVQGLPFFAPLYDRSATITFYSSRSPELLREILWGQMVTPYFPVRFDDIAALVNFVQVSEAPLDFGGAQVSCFCLTHPQGATGFKMVYAGKTVVYATDHEHGEEAADLRLRRAAQGADLLFYDAQYTPEEYPSRRGWGHGTWLEATKVGAEADVKLFHHDPAHNDEDMDRIVGLARERFSRTTAAAEGETITIA
jgi:phosphoribosyl 1,2-cyclic phosphodiesterase